ncbi:MAG: Hsp20/alpha crystallin family protein [Bacillota bacterium]|nr:Hsp20/alpha crystallin family protein [Bacillota bacterium]
MFEIMPYGFRRVSAYNPFREMEEMTRSFWNDGAVNAFRTDISEKDGVYTLEAELPGFKKEDISIDLEKDSLTISAERKEETEDGGETNYIRRERFYGSYTRSFNVRGIDTDAISAEYSDGVLKLTMPRKTPETPAARRLEIN